MKCIRLILILVLCIGLVGGALAQEARWKELHDQALQLLHEGKCAEGFSVATQALDVAEKTFGPNHANVAKSLGNLADLYWAQRKYAEAEPLYKRSLAIREKALGPEHPKVADSLDDLAEVYRKTGKAEEATKLEERAQNIKSQSGSR